MTALAPFPSPPQSADVEPQPNLPLLSKILAHIDTHPEEWRQRHWASRASAEYCGTGFCIAGHAAFMSGAEIDWDEGGFADEAFLDGEKGLIPEIATEVLGITYGESVALFAANNGREDVQRVAEAIAARAGERL